MKALEPEWPIDKKMANLTNKWNRLMPNENFENKWMLMKNKWKSTKLNERQNKNEKSPLGDFFLYLTKRK
jgi:hypothetical protein